MSEPTVLYFGCIGVVGHYLHHGERGHIGDQPAHLTLGGKLWPAIDGKFCPPPSNENGRYLVTKVEDWTIISWWDNSVDSRPGSYSTFLFRNIDGAPEELLAAARVKFPSVFARQLREIKPITETN